MVAFCRRKLCRNLHLFFFGVVVLLTVYMNIWMADSILDGDASQPFLKGWVIAQQHDLFTNDLYQTTEVRFLDTGAVASFFFLFTDNWTLVRVLTTLTLQTWYVCSFLFLCRQIEVQFPQALTVAGMMLLPISISYARIVIYHMYYLIHASNLFLLMGMVIKLLKTQRNSKCVGMWIFMGVCWLLAGLEGMRYMMIIGAPLLGYAVWELLYELKYYEWQAGCICGEKRLCKTEILKLLKILLVACTCFLIGYAINSKILLPYYGVEDGANMWYLPTHSAQHYADIFHGWLRAWGVRVSTENVVGVRGISLIAAVVLSVAMLVLSFSGMPGRKKTENRSLEQRMVQGMFFVSLVSTTLVFVFDSVYRLHELYFLLVIVLMWPLLAQELTFAKTKRTSAAQKLILLVSCGCILFQGMYSLYFIRIDKEKLDKWTGLGYTEINTVDQVRDCVDFMKENGYTHALIDYWYANPMIEMSDGELCVGPLGSHYQEERKLELYRWGTYKSAFEPENMPDKMLVFIKRIEKDGFEATFPKSLLVHEGWIFNGYEVAADQLV